MTDLAATGGIDAGTLGGVLPSAYHLTLLPAVDAASTRTLLGAAQDSAVVHLAGSETLTGRKIVRVTPSYNGIQSTDTDVAVAVESGRTISGSDTLGDRYEVFRVGDGRGATASHRLGVFQKRGAPLGSNTWEYTQWTLTRCVDGTNQGEIKFGSDNAITAIVMNCDSLGVNVESTTGAGSVQLADALRVGRFTVATLPAAGFAGRIAFATNGRKNGEGAGSGTGVQVYDDGTAWRRVSDDSTVAA